MNRKAIAKRLENLSKVFNPETPFCRDLKAMAYVISNMTDEKFRTIIKEELQDFVDFEEDEDDDNIEDKEISLCKDLKEDDSDDDDVVYSFWSVEASNKVQESLLREIVGMEKEICCDTGRKLTEEQIPDGTHKGLPEKPDTLINKQTPDISKSINSRMVEKVKRTEIRKDAAKKCEVVEEEKKKGKKEKKEEEQPSSIVEGVELLASMNEFELTPNEIDELSNLFK